MYALSNKNFDKNLFKYDLCLFLITIEIFISYMNDEFKEIF